MEMTKKEQDLSARIGRLNKDLYAFLASIRPEKMKSRYITCEHCGSKIRNDLFTGADGLNCPACHAPHISESAKARIASFKTRIRDAEKQLKAERSRREANEAKAAKTKAEEARKAAEKKEADRGKLLRKVRRQKTALSVELLGEDLAFGEYRDYECKAKFRLGIDSPSAMTTFRKLVKSGKLAGSGYDWDFDKRVASDFKSRGHASCEVVVPRFFEFSRFGKTQEVAGETVRLTVMQEHEDYSFDAVFRRSDLYRPKIADEHHFGNDLDYEFGATAAPECSLRQYGEHLLRMGCFA